MLEFIRLFVLRRNAISEFELKIAVLGKPLSSLSEFSAELTEPNEGLGERLGERLRLKSGLLLSVKRQSQGHQHEVKSGKNMESRKSISQIIQIL